MASRTAVRTVRGCVCTYMYIHTNICTQIFACGTKGYFHYSSMDRPISAPLVVIGISWKGPKVCRPMMLIRCFRARLCTHTCSLCLHTYMHACIHTYIHTYVRTYIHTCMHACIHTYIHTYRETQRQGDKETESQRDRETVRQRETDRDRQRQTETLF